MLDWLLRIFDYLIAIAFVGGCISAILLSLRPRPQQKPPEHPLKRGGPAPIFAISPNLRPEDAWPLNAGAGELYAHAFEKGENVGEAESVRNEVQF